MRAKPSLAFTSVLMAFAALSSPADAACKKFGFTVNDYGKEGPTNDAKNLLDKHISEWAAQNGVKEYQTGKKSVSCELFLDVILFDEHTCTASATVCWGDGIKNKTGQQTAANDQPADEESGDHPPAPIRKAEAMGVAPQQAAAAETPAAETPAPAATEQTPTEQAPTEQAAAPAAPTAPVEQAAAPATTPAATPAVQQSTAAAATTPPASGTGVETGALQAGAGMATAPAADKPPAPGVSEKDRAAAAAAAASAAAAAERAAAAAETAANAAKEAAAAAVAASAASKGTASVPPLDHASGAKPAHNE